MNALVFVVLVSASIIGAILFGVACLTAKFLPSFPVAVAVLAAGFALTLLLAIASYLAEQEHLRFVAKIGTTTAKEWTDEAMGHAIGMSLLLVCRWVVVIVTLGMALYHWLFK